MVMHSARILRRLYPVAAHGLLTWVLSTSAIASASAVLVGCGAKAGESTDTGNPPFIDTSRVRIVAGDGTVTVTGEPGAAKAGTSIRVKNVTTGAVQNGDVGPNGSFALTIAGTANDEYSIQIVGVAGSQSLHVETGPDGSELDASAGGDAGFPYELLTCSQPGADPEPLEGSWAAPECGHVMNEVNCRAAQVVAGIDTTCDTDEDCVAVRPGCGYFCEQTYAVSKSQADAVNGAMDAMLQDVCSLVSCGGHPPCPSPAVTECIEHQCQALGVGLFEPEPSSAGPMPSAASVFYPTSCDDPVPPEEPVSACDVASNDAACAFAKLGRAVVPCVTDEDCSFVFPQIECGTYCFAPVPAAADGVESVQAEIDAISAEVCADVEETCGTPCLPGFPTVSCGANGCHVGVAL